LVDKYQPFQNALVKPFSFHSATSYTASKDQGGMDGVFQSFNNLQSCNIKMKELFPTLSSDFLLENLS
jgi:hypothetical protein